MAYFLKVSKQQSRTYLSIYESFYSPDVKGTKHRSVKNLGNIDNLIASGIDDPIAYYKEEVKKMNAQRKQEKASQKLSLCSFRSLPLRSFWVMFPFLRFLTPWMSRNILIICNPLVVFTSMFLTFSLLLCLPELFFLRLNTGLFMISFLLFLNLLLFLMTSFLLHLNSWVLNMKNLLRY